MGAKESCHIADLCMGLEMFWGLSKFEELIFKNYVCVSVCVYLLVYLCLSICVVYSMCAHMCIWVYMLMELRGQSEINFLSSFYLVFIMFNIFSF